MAPNNRDAFRRLRAVAADASPEARAKAAAERAALEQELELAHARREMRRALVAKLVEEYRTRPMQVRMRSLRNALVERDIVEDECGALERAIEKALGGATMTRLRRGKDLED